MNEQRPTGVQGYDKVASYLLSQRLPFATVHHHIMHLIPANPSRILDVGAGPGHDAATLARQAHTVVAVEPTWELREGAKKLYADLPIEWLDDSLPRLERLVLTCVSPFDFILLEGVWAHLDENEREEAFGVLAGLLADGGVLAISLRHGPAAPGRVTFPVSAAETIKFAEQLGLSTLVQAKTGSVQSTNIASGVTWTRLAFGKSFPSVWRS